MRPIAAVLFAVAAAWGGAAHGQLPPAPLSGPGIRGQVLDAGDTRPIAGAIVVVRWPLLEPMARGSDMGPALEYDFVDLGDSAHRVETVAGRDGGFSVSAWGPVLKNGRVGEPELMAFAPGYTPAMRLASEKPAGKMRLKRRDGDDRAYAQAIARFQRQALKWEIDAAWNAIPKMTFALYLEKARLGEAGEAIIGANRMPHRSGRTLPVVMPPGAMGGALAWVEWTLMPLSTGLTRRRVVQVIPSSSIDGGALFISPWRLPGPDVAGWIVDPSVKPRVRIFGYGIVPSAWVAWEESGVTVPVATAADRNALPKAELASLRRDLDTALAGPERQEELRLLAPLLAHYEGFCRRLTPDLQKEACYDTQSDVGRAIVAWREAPQTFEETAGGRIRVTQERRTGTTVTGGNFPPQMHAVHPVQGFTIEPGP